MGDDWESIDTSKPLRVPPKINNDRWEGEDEDDVKDNWDDEEEEDNKDNAPVAPQPRKQKRTKQQIIAEREEKQRQEAEERRKQKEEELKNASPEEVNREKLRRQKMQEEADLRTAMETCGVSAHGSIDAITPVDKDDYDNLRKLLVAKLTPNEGSVLYVQFLDDLLRDLVANLAVEDIKGLSSTISTVANEKQKLAKSSKGKKKKNPTLKYDRNLIEDPYDGGEYDDFM